MLYNILFKSKKSIFLLFPLNWQILYWQMLTDAPEVLKLGYLQQNSSNVVIIWSVWFLPVQPALKCSQPASDVFGRNSSRM